MPIDFTRYQRPGVYTEDTGGPQLAVRSSVPTAVAIFGLARGYRTHRESVVIRPDTTDDEGDVVPAANKELSKSGIHIFSGNVVAWVGTDVTITAPGDALNSVVMKPNDYVRLYNQDNKTENGLWMWHSATTPMTRAVDSFEVVNPDTGTYYVNGLDFTIAPVSGGDDAHSQRDNTYTIKRINRPGGIGIKPGDVVQVSYRYTDPTYHDVQSLYDYDDVRDIYGEPFDPDGTIVSEVTLAAKFAFMNGASTVLTCAVDTESNIADSNPPVAKSLQQQYQDALDKMRDQDTIAIIVPGTGESWVYPMVQVHVNRQSDNKYERLAILGFDGAKNAVATSVRVAQAKTLADRRIALVSPSRFYYWATELGKSVNKNTGISLGGQYMAAAIAGKAVSQIPAMPLTRKNILGFAGPAPEPGASGISLQREGEKDYESSQGLMVVEKTRRNQIQVRHGVTTKSDDLLKREWSIVRQQDTMVYRIRDYLDADGLIGMPIYDTTLIQVKASAEAALVSLVRDAVIAGYKSLKVRQIATLPDVIEVRYEWKPAYPLNYIVVRYSVAVETGDITINTGSTETGTANGTV